MRDRSLDLRLQIDTRAIAATLSSLHIQPNCNLWEFSNKRAVRDEYFITFVFDII